MIRFPVGGESFLWEEKITPVDDKVSCGRRKFPVGGENHTSG